MRCYPFGISIGDINGDAKPDLVIPAVNLGVSQNNSSAGTISFAPVVYLFIFPQANEAGIADITGDGKADLACPLVGNQAISLIRNKNNEPTVRSFTPTTVAAGNTVTITGVNFTGTAAVSFGGTPAASFTVVDATTITAVVGTGISGDVSVTNQYGTGKKAGFIFAGPPVITSFTPTTATSATTITITGTNFTGATAVSFGGLPASGFTVESPTTISAVVGEAASGNVSVTTPYGTGSLAGLVILPKVVSFSPASAATGETITITATNITGVNAVSFGGTPAVSFTVVNASTITAIVAADHPEIYW
ncbi:MAG: IPT/TIG domain-containing protein [Bacteroidota bacterium]